MLTDHWEVQLSNRSYLLLYCGEEQKKTHLMHDILICITCIQSVLNIQYKLCCVSCKKHKLSNLGQFSELSQVLIRPYSKVPDGI